MFKNKFIKNKKGLYKIYRKKGSKVLILTKTVFSKNVFLAIISAVESDLHTGDFNYKGSTVLEIQLLTNLDSNKRITLFKLKKFAIVLIR